MKFGVTNEADKLAQLYGLCGTEWSGRLTAQEFGELGAELHIELNEAGLPAKGFFLEDVETGKVVASTTVKRGKGFYKEVERSNAINSTPDPAVFGVKHVNTLLVGYVFTDKLYRGQGLASQLIRKAIDYTEEEIIQEHLAKSDDAKNDSFKNMVLTDGQVDRQLANYYLSKEYFWYLYSAVGDFYQKFGFKGYALDVYKIPSSILTTENEELIESLLDSSSPHSVGKLLKLLKRSVKQDRDLISYLLQGKELEILTELNKLLFHSELSGGHKSSSSLTNMSNILSMSKLGSSNELSSINESNSQPLTQARERRRSSIQQVTVPKFAMKPSYSNLHHIYRLEESQAAKIGDAKAVEFNDIKGAIFTNELQQKNYYILWAALPINKLYIIGMGEMKFDLFGAVQTPEGGRRRRGSSFTGLNELGGFNFQDLNILLHTAVYVAKYRQTTSDSAIYVSANDLPSHIPSPVLHDYILNYLPQTFHDVHSQDDPEAPEETKVEFITDSPKSLIIYPMLKKFGSFNHEFDLDWYDNGLWSWG